jgi:hypothetical protein
MACRIRQATGACSHHQCPYPDETVHGYQCVDFFTSKLASGLVQPFCEAGVNCLGKCRYSYPLSQAAEIDEGYEKLHPHDSH